MKVLLSYHQQLPAHRLGWRRALERLGHEVIPWDRAIKPAFDVFGEVEPDVYIGSTQEIDRATTKCLLRKNIHVVLEGRIWGDFETEVDIEDQLELCASLEEKYAITNLVNHHTIPTIISHYSAAQVANTHNGWNQAGCNTISLPLAADTVDFFPGEVRAELVSDLCFIGAYHSKAESLNQLLLPLCEPVGKLNIKVWGHSPHPLPQYLGYIQTENMRDAFASALGCLNTYQPLALKYGLEANERLYKILAANGVCLSQIAEAPQELAECPALLFVSSPDDIVDSINYLRRHADQRPSGVEFIRRSHTYDVRMIKLCEILNVQQG